MSNLLLKPSGVGGNSAGRETDGGRKPPLTRAQMAGLLYQLFGDGAEPETASPFVDVTEPWQTAPVARLLANETTTGTSPTTFHPDRNVTRGEFATFLWRYQDEPPPTERICQTPPCGSGLVKFDEFVTETGNGCRQANCYGTAHNPAQTPAGVGPDIRLVVQNLRNGFPVDTVADTGCARLCILAVTCLGTAVRFSRR